MWIPARTSVGAAAILPTMKGFCATQAIIVWLAIQGIGLADTVCSQFASNPLGSDGQVYTGVDMTANVLKLATSLLLTNVCAESANQAIAKDRASGGMGARMFGSMTFGPTHFSNRSSSGQVQTGYTYGETSDRLGLQAACGSVTLTLSAPPSKSSIEPTGQTQEQLVNVQNVTAVVEKAHQTALPALQAAMDTLAKQIVNPNSKVSAQQGAAAIDVGVNAYSTGHCGDRQGSGCAAGRRGLHPSDAGRWVGLRRPVLRQDPQSPVRHRRGDQRDPGVRACRARSAQRCRSSSMTSTSTSTKRTTSSRTRPDATPRA